MLLNVLSLLHNATTLLFGVYISAAFLGVRMNRKNILTLLAFSLAVGGVYIGAYLLLGTSGTEQIYPLIIHLPLAVFLVLRFKYRPILAALAVLTTYLCCQISNWAGLAALSLTGQEWVYYSVRIAVTVAVFVLLILYVSDATATLLQKSTKTLTVLGLIPFFLLHLRLCNRRVHLAFILGAGGSGRVFGLHALHFLSAVYLFVFQAV